MRHIGWALLAKTVALAAVYFAFFGPAHRQAVDSEQMRAMLFTQSGAPR